ncbi:YARHG domain-containing protein [Prevotella vespertina]|jgi:non-specific serine/threonine protein kinase|nr:YARHG domain-containing protein [Prevotella vespertina]
MKAKLFKKVFFMVSFCLLSLSAMAQIPSIPRRTTTYRNYQPGVVWGTQYDYLSLRYVTYDDIAYLDRGQIRVLKNSIYARHGRRFQDARLRRYFLSQSWYRPTKNEVSPRELNKFEKANIAYLLKYEQ